MVATEELPATLAKQLGELLFKEDKNNLYSIK